MKERYRKEIWVGRNKISYYVKGQGKTLVLLHGFLNCACTFRYVFDTLALTNRIIAPDLPGNGNSSKSPKYDYSLDNMADFLDHFFDKLALKRFAIGGVSAYGSLALKYALKYPDRTEVLILVDSAGLKKSRSAKKGFLDLPLSKNLGEILADPDNIKALYQKQFSHKLAVPEQDIAAYLDWVTNPSGLISAEKSLRANGNFEVDDIEKITQPTLIIWGERDRVLPQKMARKFTEKIPDSRYVMIPEAGHLPHEESPEDFALILTDFLKGIIPDL